MRPNRELVRSQRLQGTGFGDGHYSPDLLDTVLVLGAFIAPMDLTLFKSFTVYDLLISLLAFLIIAGPLKLRSPPAVSLAAVSLFLAAAMLSTIRAPQPAEALTQTLQYAFIFFVQVPVIVTVVRSGAVLRAVLIAFIAGTLVGILTAYFLQLPSGGGRLQTVFNDNAGRLGAPTAYLLPFVLFFLAEWWRNGRRFIVVVVGGTVGYLFMWALAASGSRAGALGTVVSLLVFVAFRGITHRPRHLARRSLVAATMIVILGILVLHTEYFPSTLSERITRTFTPGDELSRDRIGLDEAGLRAFGESPLVGVGLDNFRFVAWRYGAPSNQAPHNIWIQFLAQVGVVGSAMMMFIIGGWFMMLLWAEITTTDRSQQHFLWAFLASGAALMTIFMTAPVMVHRQYWLIVGLGVALAWQSGRGHLPVWLTERGSDPTPIDSLLGHVRSPVLTRPRFARTQAREGYEPQQASSSGGSSGGWTEGAL
jgi:O-antigen ligase